MVHPKSRKDDIVQKALRQIRASAKAVKSYAIVGIHKNGIVKDVFVIRKVRDEAKVMKVALKWANKGRIVRKCAINHAEAVKGKEWTEPGDSL